METTLQINDKYVSVLQAINYKTEDALNEFLQLKLNGKIAEYKDDCEFYRKKYNMLFHEFEDLIESRCNEEDITQWNDYLAWKFAEESKQFYYKELDIIK